MSTRIRITKKYEGYQKGDILELRSAEAKQILKAGAGVVQTDIGSETITTKGKTDGRTQRLRTNNRRRR